LVPSALKKADSLQRHARYLGVPLSEFQLALTLGEGYELLDFLANGGMGQFQNHALLCQDIADAKLKGDPFKVLTQFQLEGLDIVRVEDLN
jgi:hypothetical protein